MSDMKRREFISLLGGAAVWPITAWAQGERMRRIGVLETTSMLRISRRFAKACGTLDTSRNKISLSSIAPLKALVSGSRTLPLIYFA
jgi:hypothetical protein